MGGLLKMDVCYGGLSEYQKGWGSCLKNRIAFSVVSILPVRVSKVHRVGSLIK
jgi:hypothetical protein